MKRHMITAALLGAGMIAAASAHANNTRVEAALAGYPDTSLFYQALLNTGVMNELRENVNYTVFVPTNSAFAEIQPGRYPCFYAVQCRAQLASVLRDHISVGRQSLRDLDQEAEVPTIGTYKVYADQPYVGEHEIAYHRVLSGADIDGNMIYRINGVIINHWQLAQFQALPPVASNSDSVTEEKTITTYRTPVAYEVNGYPVPGGGYPACLAPETVTEKTYVVPDSTTTTVYPAPGGETTTITTMHP